MAFLAAICCTLSAVFIKPVSAESATVSASSLFVTQTTKTVKGKTNTVNAGANGITFDMGTTVDKKSGEPSTVSLGNQTENALNGVFKGDFGMKYSLTDYFGYTDYNAFKTGENATSIVPAQAGALNKIGGLLNTLLTFRIKPVSGEQYIDINLVTFNQQNDNGVRNYYILGHLVVAYYDGSTTQYRTVPFVADGSKDYGGKTNFGSVAFRDINNVFSSSMKHFNPGINKGIAWAPSVAALSGDMYLMPKNDTGFKLVWDNDVLKIVGTNYADVAEDGSPAEHTYAAFDGADFSDVKASNNLSKDDIENIGNDLGIINYESQRDFFINGCGLPKVNNIFGDGYTVSVINHGEKLSSVFLNSVSFYNESTSTGYTIKSITGSANGTTSETTVFDGETVAKPSWLQEAKTATVTVDGSAQTIDLPVSGTFNYIVPESSATVPSGKMFSYFEGSDGLQYIPGDTIVLTENMNVTLTSKFTDAIGAGSVFVANPTVGENGAAFNLGNTITKSGTGTTDDPYSATVNKDGTRKENKLNGKFSGNLAIEFNINDVWGYQDRTQLLSYMGATSRYNAYKRMLQTYGAWFQSIMTFRVTPASGESYIDIHVVLHTKDQEMITAKLVVDYYNGENHYIRTIDYYSNQNAGFKGYTSMMNSANWWTQAGVSSTNDNSEFSSSTLKLVWEGDVLKIVGQEAGKQEYTYAAFDGALYDISEALYTDDATVFTSLVAAEKEKGAQETKKVIYEGHCNHYVNGCGLPVVADTFKEDYTVSVFNYGTVDLQSTASYDTPATVLKNSSSGTQNIIGNRLGVFRVNDNTYSNDLASSYTIKSINGSSFTSETMPMPYWYDNFATIELGNDEIEADAGAGCFTFPEYTGTVADGCVFGGYYYSKLGITYQPGDNIDIEKDKTYTFTIQVNELGTVTVDGVKQSLEGDKYSLPALAQGSYGWVVNGGEYTGKVYKAGAEITVNLGDHVTVTSLKITDLALDTNVTARITENSAESGLRFTLKFKAAGLTAMSDGVSFKVIVNNSEYAGKPIEFAFDSNEYLIAETDGEGISTGEFSFVSTIVNFTLDAHKTGTITVSASMSVTYADDTAQTVNVENSLTCIVSDVASAIKASAQYTALSDKQKAVVDEWIVANN